MLGMRTFQCFIICVEVIIYLLLYNLHGCTFKVQKQSLDVFCKKGARGNFTKFTGKHLC